MYQQWFKEYMQVQVHETKWGFVTYRIEGETIHAPDIYVLPEYRRQGKARELSDAVAEIGRKAGCKVLTGVVQMDNPARDASVLFLLNYGAKILNSGPDKIYFYKEL